MSRALCLVLLTGVAACDLPAERAPGTGPVVLATQPRAGDSAVDRGGPFRVFFDRPLFPRDLHRGRVRIQSGAQSAFLSPWFEPVDRVLELELIGEPLAPSVRYRMFVEQIRDLELTPMEERLEITFETGVDSTSAPPEEVPFGEVASLLDRCASPGCHGGTTPALGLDLSSAAMVRETAIGVTAVGSRIGTQRDDPWHGTSTLDGLARIDVVGGVGRPAQSYLMYELLEEGGASHAEALDPPLSRDELRLVSRWIRAGASTD